MSFIVNNFKILIFIISLLFAIGVGSAGYNFYHVRMQQLYSNKLHKIMFDLNAGQHDLAIQKLKTISGEKDTPIKLKSLAKMQLASAFMETDSEKEAIDVYKDVFKNRRYDKFVKDLAGILALELMINSEDDYSYDIQDLINKLSSRKSDIKYFALEQKALYMWKMNDYEGAKKVFDEISQDDACPINLKNRSIEMIQIYNSENNNDIKTN